MCCQNLHPTVEHRAEFWADRQILVNGLLCCSFVDLFLSDGNIQANWLWAETGTVWLYRVVRLLLLPPPVLLDSSSVFLVAS